MQAGAANKAFTSVAVDGFTADLGGFVAISGTFAFQRTSSGDLLVVASDAAAAITAGSLKRGAKDGTLGLQLNSDGTVAFRLSGTPDVNLGTSFGTIGGTAAPVTYNSSAVAYNNVTLTVG